MIYYTEVYYIPETDQIVTVSASEEDRKMPIVHPSWMLLDGFYEHENFEALTPEEVADLVGGFEEVQEEEESYQYSSDDMNGLDDDHTLWPQDEFEDDSHHF